MYLMIILFVQSDLHEAKEELNEKAQHLETRNTELKMLHEKLDDSEKQMKKELQRKEADWNALQESYHKVGPSVFSVLLLGIY